MLSSVYIIFDNKDNFKIGVSSNTEKRLKALNTANPNILSLIYESNKISNAYKIESLIHQRYKHLKINSEWFKIDDIEELKEYIDFLVEEIGYIKKENSVNKNPLEEQIKKIKTEYEEIKKLTQNEKEKNINAMEFLNYIQFGITGGIYADFIYKILFGKSFNELKEIYQIKAKESLRDYISTEELKELEQMEMLISSLINLGWGYNQIKEFIMQNQIKKLAC